MFFFSPTIAQEKPPRPCIRSVASILCNKRVITEALYVNTCSVTDTFLHIPLIYSVISTGFSLFLKPQWIRVHPYVWETRKILVFAYFCSIISIHLSNLKQHFILRTVALHPFRIGINVQKEQSIMPVVGFIGTSAPHTHSANLLCIWFWMTWWFIYSWPFP